MGFLGSGSPSPHLVHRVLVLSHDGPAHHGKLVAEADASLREVVSNPGSKALEHFNAGEWTSAIKFARQQSSKKSCGNVIKAEMHHIEAACFYQMNQLVEAEKAIRVAVFLEPTKKIISIPTE